LHRWLIAPCWLCSAIVRPLTFNPAALLPHDLCQNILLPIQQQKFCTRSPQTSFRVNFLRLWKPKCVIVCDMYRPPLSASDWLYALLVFSEAALNVVYQIKGGPHISQPTYTISLTLRVYTTHTSSGRWRAQPYRELARLWRNAALYYSVLQMGR
jgi:hypothetical protein